MTKQLDAAIVLPKDFGQVKNGDTFPSGQAKVIYTQNNAQSGAALIAVMNGQFKVINGKLVTIQTPFTVKG